MNPPSSITTFVLSRLGQESTYRGIIALLMSAGLVIRPDLVAAIVPLCMSIIGLINIIKNK